MNETFKNLLVNNAAALFIAGCSVVFFIFGYILSLRADTNAAVRQANANAQTIQQQSVLIDALVPEVAALKQESDDTNTKVSELYSHFLGK